MPVELHFQAIESTKLRGIVSFWQEVLAPTPLDFLEKTTVSFKLQTLLKNTEGGGSELTK